MTRSDVTICRLANAEDLPLVADIHIKAFPGFFLTTLGASFLRVMYKAFLLDARGIFVVGELVSEVNGFAVGSLKSNTKDRHLAMRLLPQFVWELIPSVLQNPSRVLKRVLSQFFAEGGAPSVPHGSAVLRSIGVSPEMRGHGVASQLIKAFELRAIEMGAVSVALTTDVLDNERAIQFYRKHGYEITHEFKQDKYRSMFFMLKDLK